ncbi:MAG: hypothetical protein ACLFPM_04420 [Candidatus Izemoplasmatales bacterium]
MKKYFATTMLLLIVLIGLSFAKPMNLSSGSNEPNQVIAVDFDDEEIPELAHNRI